MWKEFLYVFSYYPWKTLQETDNIGCLLGRDLDGQKQSRKKHFFFSLYPSKFQLCEYISYSLKRLVKNVRYHQ